MYIAVHGGAGVHSSNPADERVLRHALRRACSHALKNERNSALHVVEDTISILEDEPSLNAGYGSNLTIDGTVECDASIMDGLSGHFGSVGAVSGIKNPIRLAEAILEHSTVPDVLGRIPPMTLVSEGARAFALSFTSKRKRVDVETVHPETLISPRAKAQWVKWSSRLPDDLSQEDSHNNIQDTVGAVVWDDSNGMAAGVSSGGLLLKYPGRIGEAAIFGAGCWAQNGMACSISGTGEHIVRAGLAKAIGDAMKHADANVDVHAILHKVLIEGFCTPCRDRGDSEPKAGVVLLTTEPMDDHAHPRRARLWCAFTTPSFAIAYVSSKWSDPKPKALILRRPDSMNGREEPSIFITAMAI